MKCDLTSISKNKKTSISVKRNGGFQIAVLGIIYPPNTDNHSEK